MRESLRFGWEPSPNTHSNQIDEYFRFAFTVGLGNDSIGYIVEPEGADLDPSGRLRRYELNMGLAPAGPCVWAGYQSLFREFVGNE